MSFLDLLIPPDGPEREAALTAIEASRATGPVCDCDRCCADCPHEPWCPANHTPAPAPAPGGGP